MQAFFGTLFKMLALHSFKLSVILFIINTKDIFQQALFIISELPIQNVIEPNKMKNFQEKIKNKSILTNNTNKP